MGDSTTRGTIAWHAAQQSPVLRAKLRPPSTPAHLVDRQRLYDGLNELTISDISATKKACNDAAMTLEAQYTTALGNVTGYETTGHRSRCATVTEQCRPSLLEQ